MVRATLLCFILVTFTHFLSTAQIKIEGKVTDPNGEPLFGAQIKIKDTYYGTQTDEKGAFGISGMTLKKEKEYTLSIDHLGFKKKTLKFIPAEKRTFKVELVQSPVLAGEIVISGTRIDEGAPIPKYEMKREEIEKRNIEEDVPYMLEQTPSAVANSDAGTGIGYSNLRIRGSSPSRINVTINGIPLNDAESQGVYWVDIPDIAASTDNIQIQRGVGSSTNGAGAFGGTIDINTMSAREEPFASTAHTYGSFNTMKNNIRFGTGRINGNWEFQGRASHVTSDGYIDRATAEMRSYYLSGAYRAPNTSVEFLTFSGKERTYQAWYGMPKKSLDTNRTFNPYNYEDETDNYVQTHYQLHFDQRLTPSLFLNTALHYTKGKGYYEQYKGDDHNNTIANASKALLSDYGLEPVLMGSDTIRRTDLIQRRWLDNDLYGGTFSLKYRPGKGPNLTLGGAWNRYIGAHYGEVIWARYMSNGEKGHRFYDNDGDKRDMNLYGKATFHILEDMKAFVDIQYRRVDYSFLGVDNDGDPLDQSIELDFINPKAGLSYQLSGSDRVYGSYSKGTKEPNRSDYVDAPPNSQPVPEKLNDYELGYERSSENYSLVANLYYMDYEDQLVETGKLNEVGRTVRDNVPSSFRRGIEIQAGVRAGERLEFNANATYSQNRIQEYTQYIDDFSTGEQVALRKKNTSIAMSPQWIQAAGLDYIILDGTSRGLENKLSISWQEKFVGRQYIDNTSSLKRSLDPYMTHDLSLTYRLNGLFGKKDGRMMGLQLRFLVRNILDEHFVTKAWVYRYKVGGEFQQTGGYFPHAGRHYLGQLRLEF